MSQERHAGSLCSVVPQVIAPTLLRALLWALWGQGLLHQVTLQPVAQQVVALWNVLPRPGKQWLLENTVKKFPVIKELPASIYTLLCSAM